MKKFERETRPRNGNAEPAISRSFDDGTLIELILYQGKTAFAVWREDEWDIVPAFDADEGALCPYNAENNILRHGVVLLPSTAEEYEDEERLIQEIERYINRYVDLTPQSLHLASHYVLLTWLFDRFNELPYLRLRGDYGSGKTRFLLIVGSVCYKPIFASGASTVSPLFHLLDAFRGTLILDEADFRFSDAKADMVKILNAGNVRGMPILRTMINSKKEFDPRAFSVFGPKIIAGRGRYDDPALESRCITEETRSGRIRSDIPINLPKEYEIEAQVLRNKLLLYRFRNFQKTEINHGLVNSSVDNRVNQIYLPLLSVTKDRSVRAELFERQHDGQDRLADERGQAIEAQVLEVIHELKSTGIIKLKDIATAFSEKYSREFTAPITSRFIGDLLRGKLQIRTKKSNGVYVIPISEQPKLKEMFNRYSVTSDSSLDDVEIIPVDQGDFGDAETIPVID